VATKRRQPRRAGLIPPAGSVARARLLVVAAAVAAAVVLFAWFPASSLMHQRSTLGLSESQLATLHRQDAALAQEKKNLSAPGEIGRLAREQYQLVSPGQQAFEVLPPAGAATTGSAYAGDPGAQGPVAPSATAELPPGATTATTVPTSVSGGTNPAPGAGAGSGSGGLLARMVRTLEFWR